MKPLLLLCIPLLLTACATAPQADVLAQANAVGYGADLAPGWEERIKSFMELRLKDPASAMYKFGVPEKGWVTKPPIKGGGLDTAGYIVHVLVNARNSYGGYTGFKQYSFLFRDNQIVKYAADGLWR